MPVNPTRIILGGAGTRLLYYVGALKIFQEKGYKFKEFVGVSAGSILCMLMALGLSLTDIEKTILNYDFRSIFHPDPFSPERILDATDTWGLDDGQQFKNHIAKFLEDHGFSSRITFAQLARLTRHKLRILACDIEDARYFEFSATTTPSVSIIDGIYASCAIPLYFQPMHINGRILVDGGLVHSFPLTYFTKKELSESIGLQLLSSVGKKKPVDSLDYFWRVCGLILNPPAPYRVPGNIYSISVDSFFLNWDITQQEKRAMIYQGYLQVKKQMQIRIVANAIKRRHSI